MEKELKLRIYTTALRELKKDAEVQKQYPYLCLPGLCSYMIDALRDLGEYEESYNPYTELRMDIAITEYPEIVQFRPARDEWARDWWFTKGIEGTKKRIEILEKAIEMCIL